MPKNKYQSMRYLIPHEAIIYRPCELTGNYFLSMGNHCRSIPGQGRNFSLCYHIKAGSEAQAGHEVDNEIKKQ